MTAVATMIDTPPLSFSAGLPGFPEARTFVLINNELAREPFAIMRCIEDEELEFVVVTPDLFFPDYSPQIDEATALRIDLESAEDALILVLLTVGDDVASITANLLGPVIVNRKNYSAAQVILTNAEYDFRTPLFSDVTH